MLPTSFKRLEVDELISLRVNETIFLEKDDMVHASSICVTGCTASQSGTFGRGVRLKSARGPRNCEAWLARSFAAELPCRSSSSSRRTACGRTLPFRPEAKLRADPPAGEFAGGDRLGKVVAGSPWTGEGELCSSFLPFMFFLLHYQTTIHSITPSASATRSGWRGRARSPRKRVNRRPKLSCFRWAASSAHVMRAFAR